MIFEGKTDLEWLKETIENNRCDEHQEVPKVHIYNDIITFTCCCAQFHYECRGLAKELNEVLGIENLVIR